MDKRFVKQMSELTDSVMPLVNRKCKTPNCDHTYCVKDAETGEWYDAEKTPKPPSEDELIPALLAVQIKQLNAIRKMLKFFTILTIIGLLAWAAVLISPFVLLR